MSHIQYPWDLILNHQTKVATLGWPLIQPIYDMVISGDFPHVTDGYMVCNGN